MIDFESIIGYISAIEFTTIFDCLGTFAFAISGIRLASAKHFDWFGAYVVGIVTAVGGGTVRDILLNATPFWMETPSYIIISGIAVLFVALFRKQTVRLNTPFFIFDTIGLGLFAVVGIAKTLDFGFPMWVAIIMGTITGSFGGMIRDILINEEPLIFRKDIYALACVFGGVAYYICLSCSLTLIITQIIAALTVIVTRLLAVKFHISVPILKGE
ncbi:putative membrane protein YeiH [Dysgonomonadaceae bacterium PH5-43]|nr:putative membrane protein YeiH [Dysgonomonadaceae bacterium PH5-43]